MLAGELRDRINIYRPLDSDETTQNSYGRDQGSAEFIGNFACAVEAMQGREYDKSEQRWSNSRYQIKMRPQPGITFTSKMYGVWNGQQLNFLDVPAGNNNRLRPKLVIIAENYQ